MVEFVMGPEPRFTQEADYIPARLDKHTQRRCSEMAKSIIRALGFDNCGFHCELRISPQGPVLIEIAARLPGGPLQLGYKQAYGINLTSLMADIWLGKKITLQPKINNYVLQKAVFPRNKGKIINISGVNEAEKIMGVWDFAQITTVDENITTYPDIPKPFYYYAISAKSLPELENISKKVEQTVKITIK